MMIKVEHPNCTVETSAECTWADCFVSIFQKYTFKDSRPAIHLWVQMNQQEAECIYKELGEAIEASKQMDAQYDADMRRLRIDTPDGMEKEF